MNCILVAKDEAFNFTYRANIDALAQLGDVSYFSPLHDDIPINCDLLYLPGGYPELFLEEISTNAVMMQRIKDYAEKGGRIFAECGGFMYLCHDIDGSQMCDIFPFHATMQHAHLHLGYRRLVLPTPQGELHLRGHEFHYSEVVEDVADCPSIIRLGTQYTAKGTAVPTALYRYKNVIAGYTHWYWAESNFLPSLYHL